MNEELMHLIQVKRAWTEAAKCAEKDPSKSTSAVSVREQDVLAAADGLAERVLAEQAEECLSCVTTKERPMDCTECRWNTIGLLASAYQRVREGKR